MTPTEQHVKSLDSFKDFSNYLLVTTVAALGWVASDSRVVESPTIEVWCFALSIVFGIFTLALIPLSPVKSPMPPNPSSTFMRPTSYSGYGGATLARD